MVNQYTEQLLEKYDHGDELDFAFAYGSGAFKQTGYNEGNNPMLDYVFVVNDAEQWHAENIQKNPSDYSMIRHLGSSTVAAIQRLSAGVYYNPYAQLDDATIKYGVIESEALIKDLTEWNRLYIAGRMQKPISIQKGNSTVEGYMEQNRMSALHTAMILLPEECTEQDLYEAITGISYIGDTRKGIAENPDKVRNIVEGNMDAFRSAYADLIAIEDCITLEDDTVSIATSEFVTSSLQRILPQAAQTGLSYSQDREVAQQELRTSIGAINSQSSLGMTVKGVITAGPINSARYAIAKVKKALKKRSR